MPSLDRDALRPRSARLRRGAAGLALALVAGALGSTGPAEAAATAGAAVRAESSASVPAAYTPRPIDWGRCRDTFLGVFGLQCGWLTVPLDYADPTGETIELAVSRLVHTSSPSQYRGVMLTNPGGPGGSGTWMPLLGTSVPRGAGELWDWIGMDPRGVGASVPRLICDRTYAAPVRPAYVPDGHGEVKAWTRRARGYADACGSAPGSRLLEHVRTTDNVADMESLRIALGQDQVGFYGYSYGSYLGQVYATQHPDRVKAMVLDANVDSGQVWYDANLDQSRAFDRSAGAFFGFLASHPRAFDLGRTRGQVRRAYESLLRRVERRPIEGVGAAELTDVMTSVGYSEDVWPIVGVALNRMVRRGRLGPARLFLARPGGLQDNMYAMYLATTCSDATWPSSGATWLDDAATVYRTAPFAAWSNTWSNLPCRTWPAAPGTPVTVDGSGLATPVLLAGETGDAPTPFAGSRATRARFPSASLVAGVGGYTHGATLNGNRCLDLTVTRYLRYGQVPARRQDAGVDLACRVDGPGSSFGLGMSFRRTVTTDSGARRSREITLTRPQQIKVALLKAGVPVR